MIQKGMKAMENDNVFLIFMLAFIVALAAANFSIISGPKYMFYTLLEVALLVPIGMLVIYAIGNIIDKMFIKR
ncbi:hypothetical protein H1Z61_16745 [Bacillus aquiflavi]|uniref:Uncharacterized protein n=2 Tax=Bacillus aquiflavi TaxID=2672567 RepID=A0A6B3VY96_9BACI|nr:hypothetical protein [Bacillus aquiflavi]MBA4538729.1 hypothetical protein [Bacillus aquiflavi]NEY83089.1 hypothetical protein [Bacillus aquiflavi]